MNGTFRKRGGRPRLAGAREASGRLSRRISDSQKDFRRAQALWRDFLIARELSKAPSRLDLGGSPNSREPHPLLKLVNLGKLDASSFAVALYWTCTDIAIAPHWRTRELLTQVTGFDFGVAHGCLAARRFANERIGSDCVDIMDDAAFRGEFRTHASTLSDCLRALWRVWCSHGANGRDPAVRSAGGI
jgi:hypothetical protein